MVKHQRHRLKYFIDGLTANTAGDDSGLRVLSSLRLNHDDFYQIEKLVENADWISSMPVSGLIPDFSEPDMPWEILEIIWKRLNFCGMIFCDANPPNPAWAAH